MTKPEIQAKIEKIKASKHIADSLKGPMLKHWESELSKVEEKPVVKENLTTEPKAVETKKKAKKAKPEHKTAAPGDPDFCKQAERKWHERRTAQKKSHRKAEHTPIFQKIANDVAHAVLKAVKSVDKATSHFESEVNKLGDDAQKFLYSFKEILGSHFKPSIIAAEFKELQKVTSAHVTKHTKRKETGGPVTDPVEVLDAEIDAWREKNGAPQWPIAEMLDDSEEDNWYPTKEQKDWLVDFETRYLAAVWPDDPATEAAAEPVSVPTEIKEEKEVEKALSLATKAANHDIHATDTSFTGFKERIKGKIEGEYSEIVLKLAYDCLHVMGFKSGGKIDNRIRTKWAKFGKVMREFYHGKLKTHNRKVTRREQAQAIAYSESGVDRKSTGGTATTWMGGISAKDGLHKLSAIKEYSKKNPKDTFLVTDDNYSHIGNFYLKNGKFAKAETWGNPNYDFEHNKASLREKNDVIYKFRKVNK